MTTCLGKSCSFGLPRVPRKLLSVCVFSYFPFGFEGGIWDLILPVSDYCLSFLLFKSHTPVISQSHGSSAGITTQSVSTENKHEQSSSAGQVTPHQWSLSRVLLLSMVNHLHTLVQHQYNRHHLGLRYLHIPLHCLEQNLVHSHVV